MSKNANKMNKKRGPWSKFGVWQWSNISPFSDNLYLTISAFEIYILKNSPTTVTLREQSHYMVL